MLKIFKALVGGNAQETEPQKFPIQTISRIGNYDQLRIMTQDAEGNVSGLAVFRDGSAMKIRTSADEMMAGEPLHKAHFNAGSGAAKTIITQIDDALKGGDHAVKRALFTFPHLPERKAEFFGNPSI